MNREKLKVRFEQVRCLTEELCSRLETEEYVIQGMPDVSPAKWHLAHTTWFFERVVLAEHLSSYTPYDARFFMLFNSYYHSFGERWRRDIRGALARPTVAQVYAYREAINSRMSILLKTASDESYLLIRDPIELGIHHDQQHQELLVTDLKYNLFVDPLKPTCQESELPVRRTATSAASTWLAVSGGIVEIGSAGPAFSWDNERPKHRVLLEDFKIMNRPVTCAEYLEFIQEGGYSQPLLWLSDGWETVCREQWQAPLYWNIASEEITLMTFQGERPLVPNEPVVHISFFEADAFARWSGKRLPTEFEWEHAVRYLDLSPTQGNFLDDQIFHPQPVPTGSAADSPVAFFGDCWEWTTSSYLPYPGYAPIPGPLGEYNGKFMNNQRVLRGGSVATPRDHIRSQYRNFFQADKRWQFSGLRLANF